VLVSRPDALDVRALSTDFARQTPSARRCYCILLGKATAQPEAQDALLRAMEDADDSVRWVAMGAICSAHWKDARSMAALAARLRDTNVCLRAGAAFALGTLGAQDAAPKLLEELQAARKAPPLSAEDWHRQINAVRTRKDIRGRWSRETELPDYFPTDVMLTNRQRADLMSIFRPKNMRFTSLHTGFTFESAAIGALGNLAYAPAADFLLSELGGENHAAAFDALQKLRASTLEPALLKLALDRQADGTKRGLALNALCDLPATNHVRELLPLLDETVVLVRMRQGSDWRLCDHAACVMAKLLDWDYTGKILTEQTWRDELIKRLRNWAASRP
jgi:hypothetical protein